MLCETINQSLTKQQKTQHELFLEDMFCVLIAAQSPDTYFDWMGKQTSVTKNWNKSLAYSSRGIEYVEFKKNLHLSS
jgi:hypothetical protein